LKLRLITGLILVAASVGLILYTSPLQFALAIGIIVLMASFEWAALMTTSQAKRLFFVTLAAVLMLVLYLNPQSWFPLCLLALGFWLVGLFWVLRYPQSQSVWQRPIMMWLFGLLILIPAWTALVLLRTQVSQLYWLLYAIAIVWVADTGAYFAGRAFGKRKLAPNVSPGKSFAGAYGGVFASVVFSALASWLSGVAAMTALTLAAVTVAVALVSILGDLFESMIKRTIGVKDSGSLLPGHGGILDRIDALTSALPLFAVFYMVLLSDKL